MTFEVLIQWSTLGRGEAAMILRFRSQPATVLPDSVTTNPLQRFDPQLGKSLRMVVTFERA